MNIVLENTTSLSTQKKAHYKDRDTAAPQIAQMSIQLVRKGLDRQLKRNPPTQWKGKKRIHHLLLITVYPQSLLNAFKASD